MSENKKLFFTLIELVVVIAILGIIAAILFPIFALKKGKNPAISCLSNMKQLGMASLMYSQDYDEHFPPAEKWMTVSVPYIQNSALFLCPTARDETPKAKSSYAMDSRLSGLAEKKLKEPPSRALLYDSTRTDWDAADPGQTFAPRHSERGNVAFADGHAKARTREDFRKETR